MAARRVGHTWPGLPARGSGRRPDWRFVLLYVVITAVLAVLAFWRVARLR
jgi:cytochrome oxidase assembly protein ShyY1